MEATQFESEIICIAKLNQTSVGSFRKNYFIFAVKLQLLV